ncbi:general transcription factor II-I repeat domain-containing protein 2-like [Hydra vulgaris]|uniref:General transcription factor II-I repeat domain-containing protein 2-like n=1 Tax=Hydra vulgaris TaxID=6087 RepID=A0ABM4BPX6_HYDVU
MDIAKGDNKALHNKNIQDKPQMAVFVRYVISDVLEKEELLDSVELKDTTRGIDLKEALDTVLVKANAPKDNLVSVATDGATVVVGKNIDLMGLLNSDPTYPEFIPIHCVIHREYLAAKHFNFPIVFKSVLEIILLEIIGSHQEIGLGLKLKRGLTHSRIVTLHCT